MTPDPRTPVRAGDGYGGPAASERHHRLAAALRRLVYVEPHEVKLLLLSALYFFLVLMAYYILRPIRDEMGVRGGVQNLAWLFAGTLAGTLMVHPLFTWVVARYPRRQFIPIAYRFFSLNLVIFFVLMRTLPDEAGVWVGRIFFNWTSVFNLFVVSVFWAFMADIFRSEQGKRLFGFIAVGGTLGAMMGSAITAVLARGFGPVNLLLVSALVLEAAVWCVHRLGSWVTDLGIGKREDEHVPIGGSILAGFSGAARSPYLLGIVLYMLLFTITSTALYFQQADIVAKSFTDSGARTSFFAQIDLWVNVLALLTQRFLTGRVVRWLGLGWALAVLPLVTVVGFTLMGIQPGLGASMAGQVRRRGWNYGLMKPAMETLYTVIPREDK
ncbi:MAG: MFS transporter, partial [Gemmatimonadetes bacterium]|nr:MFS transporter [Gemmatimonadota bacterium]